MKELFQSVVMRLALCGLAASLAVLALRSRLTRDTFARLLSGWRSLTVLGRAAVCSFLLIGVLIGSDKTNGVLRTAIPVNPPIRQSANLSICQSPNLSIPQSVNPTICQSPNLSIRQSKNRV